MKRRLGVALVSVLAAALLPFTAAPASAFAADVCVGQGTAVTGAPVYYYLFGPTVPAGASANFTLAIGGCLLDPGAHGNNVNGAFDRGLVHVDPTPFGLPVIGNYCGHSEGAINASGHSARWISAASLLVIYSPQVSAGAFGVVNAVPDALAGESCTTGARQFLVTGALILTPPL
ncbi:MAG TPA: hypothetical protein VF230_11490 [Acidimicrobiales bacterium]